MFVLRIRYNSAFLPSSPLNSIVATLDEIKEGKKRGLFTIEPAQASFIKNPTDGFTSTSGNHSKMGDFMKQKWPCILTCSLDTNQVKNIIFARKAS